MLDNSYNIYLLESFYYFKNKGFDNFNKNNLLQYLYEDSLLIYIEKNLTKIY